MGQLTLRYSLLFLIVSLGAGCVAAPEPTGLPLAIVEGQNMVPLTYILDSSAITAALTPEQLILTEGAVTVTLSYGDEFIRQHDWMIDSMRTKPVQVGETVYLPEDFVRDYLGGGESRPSLYHSAKFLREEVAAALKDPTEKNSQALLAAIEMPRSMGITTLKLNTERIIRTTLLSELPADLSADLEKQGYEQPERYIYEEYEAIAGTQTLEAAGLLRFISSYPELSAVDTSRWRVKDWRRWQADYIARQQEGWYSDEEKASIQARDIRLEDMAYLRKEFHNAVLEQPDDMLRQTLTAYYQLSWI
jgi:hypothetical protein